MKRKYYVIYTDNFANTYDLVYTTPETEHLLPDGAERITRNEAIRLCRAEIDRRKYETSSSGYADTHVWPVHATRQNISILGDRMCKIDGEYYSLCNHIWMPAWMPVE